MSGYLGLNCLPEVQWRLCPGDGGAPGPLSRECARHSGALERPAPHPCLPGFCVLSSPPFSPCARHDSPRFIFPAHFPLRNSVLNQGNVKCVLPTMIFVSVKFIGNNYKPTFHTQIYKCVVYFNVIFHIKMNKGKTCLKMIAIEEVCGGESRCS